MSGAIAADRIDLTKLDEDQLIEILSRLFKTSDKIKGAILTILSGVVATKEDLHEVKKELKDEMDKRFDDVDNRLNQMDNRLNQMDKKIEDFKLEVKESLAEIKSSINNLGDRAGKGTQKMILELLKQSHKIQSDLITKISNKTIVDSEGEIFIKGYSTDIDILMENGKTILIEIKFKGDLRDLIHFFKVSKLYESKYKKPDELWFVCAEISKKSFDNIEQIKKNNNLDNLIVISGTVREE